MKKQTKLIIGTAIAVVTVGVFFYLKKKKSEESAFAKSLPNDLAALKKMWLQSRGHNTDGSDLTTGTRAWYDKVTADELKQIFVADYKERVRQEKNIKGMGIISHT